MARIFAISGVVGSALAILFSSGVVHAREFRVLHAFTGGNDGAGPAAGLILDEAGNLYGTASGGGRSGYGTVFELTPKGKETVLYSFGGPPGDGGWPGGNLIADKKGNFFSTAGGGDSGNCELGCGTIYQIKANGAESVIYSFTGEPDGQDPTGGLVAEKAGNFYGVTAYGGVDNGGMVFNISRDGIETTQYVFCPNGDQGCTDGRHPNGPLIRDQHGNLYGTTGEGGSTYAGTIFKLTPNGSETVLYSFCTQQPNCADGSGPLGGLIGDSEGNFYGTTYVGGGDGCYDGYGCGVVFKLAPDGNLTVLHAFAGGVDGALPSASLFMDARGNLYGTTQWGGGGDCNDGAQSGCGTVFEVTPKGAETVLYAFTDGDDGDSPSGSLILDANDNLYGTTVAGGAYNKGTVFELKK